MKPTWAEAKVLESVGIDPATAEDWEVSLAGICLNRCYYVDRSAVEMRKALGGPALRRYGLRGRYASAS